MDRTPRARRRVGARTILLLSPFFRFSAGREAYVLRLVGSSFGPVLETQSVLHSLAAELGPPIASPVRPGAPAARERRFVRRGEHPAQRLPAPAPAVRPGGVAAADELE